MNTPQPPVQSDDGIEQLLGLNTDNSPSRSKWRWTTYSIVLLAALIFVYYLWKADGPNDAMQYVTGPAKQSDLTVLVTATGTVQPTNTVDISSELSGTIRNVLVDYNSKVKTGEVLAELDTDKLKAGVESSKAKLAAAKAKVKDAQATLVEKNLEYRRKGKLAARKVTTAHELEASKAAYQRALAAVDSAKADVSTAIANLKLDQTNLAKTCICSPINGVVLKRNIEPGQTVASSLQAPVLFTIAEDLAKMEVQVDVDEADVGQVAKGQTAVFTVDAYPEKTFKALIRELHYGSEIVQGVVTYKAILSTSNADLLLRPGMTATAEITVKETGSVINVPNAALRFSPVTNNSETDTRSFLQKLLPGPPPRRKPSINKITGNKRVVWSLAKGRPVEIPVTIGVTDGQRTQIIKGDVTPDQELIINSTTTKN